MIAGESLVCSPVSELTHCLKYTTSGCELCETGFYENKKRCVNCPMNCTSCLSDEICTACKDDYILKDGICQQLSSVINCIQARDSICVKCKKGYKPSDDGLSCQTAPVCQKKRFGFGLRIC